MLPVCTGASLAFACAPFRLVPPCQCGAPVLQCGSPKYVASVFRNRPAVPLRTNLRTPGVEKEELLAEQVRDQKRIALDQELLVQSQKKLAEAGALSKVYLGDEG